MVVSAVLLGSMCGQCEQCVEASMTEGCKRWYVGGGGTAAAAATPDAAAATRGVCEGGTCVWQAEAECHHGMKGPHGEERRKGRAAAPALRWQRVGGQWGDEAAHVPRQRMRKAEGCMLHGTCMGTGQL